MRFTIQGKNLATGEMIELKIDAPDARAAGWAAAGKGIHVITIVPVGAKPRPAMAVDGGGIQSRPAVRSTRGYRIVCVLLIVLGLILLPLGISLWLNQSAGVARMEDRAASIEKSASDYTKRYGAPPFPRLRQEAVGARSESDAVAFAQDEAIAITTAGAIMLATGGAMAWAGRKYERVVKDV